MAIGFVNVTSDERTVAEAAVMLEQEGHGRLALNLRECELAWWTEPDEELGLVDEDFALWYPKHFAVLTAPGELYDDMAAEVERIKEAVGDALRAALAGFTIRQGEWGHEVSADNQAASLDPRPPSPVTWEGFRFRSKVEQVMAEALERAGLTFFPNCKARLGPPDDRRNLEPDFMVGFGGRWGILEVDGPWHTGRAAEDHARDREFRQLGLIVERFDAGECWRDPDDVVAQFLRVLRAPG